MSRRIRLVIDGEDLVAYYEEHEIEFMNSLRHGLDGPNAEWHRDTMLMIHEIKARFPGAIILDEQFVPDDRI